MGRNGHSTSRGNQLESFLAEKERGVLVGTKLNMNQPYLLFAKKANAFRGMLPAGWEGCAALERPHLESWSALPSKRETWTYQRESSKGWGRLKGWWEEAEKAGTVQPTEDSRRNFSMYTNTWRESAKGTEPGSFQWCPVWRPEAIGPNWCTSGEAFSLWGWVTECWHRVPREVVESPPLGMHKSLWEMVLSSVVWVTAWAQRSLTRRTSSDTFLPYSVIL